MNIDKMTTRAATVGVISPIELPGDLAGVHAINIASFTNPWTPAMVEAEALSDVGFVHVYRDRTSTVIAYCATWRVVDELHINTLAVLPAWRRRGVATELIRHVFGEARGAGMRRATLEVRPSNVAARRFYDRLGFSEGGRRRGYYTHPVEDALILWCDLDSAAS